MLNEDANEKQRLGYGTIEAAEEIVEEKLADRTDVYCVLRNGMCRTDCDCFKQPEIVDTGRNNSRFFEVKDGYCKAYMLVGPT